ncbi:MAG: hypothetical protein WED07_03180 [Candidatus Freyarchaeum deiterrae]
MIIKVVILPKAQIHIDKLGISIDAVVSIVTDIVRKGDYTYSKTWRSKYGKIAVYTGKRQHRGKLDTVWFFMRKKEKLLRIYVMGLHETTSKRARK